VEELRAAREQETLRRMFAILETPDGPALCVGYRTLDSAVAALGRLRESGGAYDAHVVVETPSEDTL
jgi:hypothetical protein